MKGSLHSHLRPIYVKTSVNGPVNGVNVDGVIVDGVIVDGVITTDSTGVITTCLTRHTIIANFSSHILIPSIPTIHTTPTTHLRTTPTRPQHIAQHQTLAQQRVHRRLVASSKQLLSIAQRRLARRLDRRRLHQQRHTPIAQRRHPYWICATGRRDGRQRVGGVEPAARVAPFFHAAANRVDDVVRGTDKIRVAGKLVQELGNGLHRKVVWRLRSELLVVAVTPFVGDRLHPTMEGDGGHKQVVVVELLDSAAGLALKTVVRRIGVIEGKVPVHVGPSLRPPLGTNSNGIVLVEVVSPGIGHGHNENVSRIE